MKSLFVALVVLIGVFSIDAYRCYVCSSIHDPGCEDPFHKNQLTYSYARMTERYQLCVKMVIGTAVARGMINASLCRAPEICGEMDDAGIRGYGCCCNSDLCNGVSSVRQQILFPLVALSMCGILVYRWF